MIPKIIHVFWGGNAPFRERSFVKQWEEVLVPNGYEIKLWTPEDFKDDNHRFIRETLDNGFWAHASDYIRFKVLYEYGGFWLDSDICVFKPFDELLDSEYIIASSNSGCPDDIGSINNYIDHNTFKFCLSCMGFSKGNDILKGVLEIYEESEYIVDTIGFECMDVSSFMLRFINKNSLCIERYNDIDNYEELLSNLSEITKYNNDKIVILPAVMFDYRFADRSLHPLMYASHKHWCHWHPHYAEHIWKKKKEKEIKDKIIKWVSENLSDKLNGVVIKAIDDFYKDNEELFKLD